MILVISYPEDPHAQRVIDWLRERQAPVALFDVSDLPAKATITVDYADPCRPHVELHRDGEPPLDLRQVDAVWWRRPQVADLSAVTDVAARQFAANEWNEAIHGLWQLVEARWMNPPGIDEIASRKAYQLRVAAETGLAIPRTLITSSPDRARAFVDVHGLGRTIFKTFSATHAVWRETRLVREQELEILDTLRLAPAIFQEYVPATVDLRVTIVGDRVFPAAIYSQGTDYPVDFRMSLGQARTEPTEIPTHLAERLMALMRRLGLSYGAIDMRRTPQDEYVFLEINTAGEFLFVEERTGQPISRALADWLSTPCGP
jgi:glutathione synthase/RimK-type ligase-like ATP-grasp enzyme